MTDSNPNARIQHQQTTHWEFGHDHYDPDWGSRVLNDGPPIKYNPQPLKMALRDILPGYRRDRMFEWIDGFLNYLIERVDDVESAISDSAD